MHEIEDAYRQVKGEMTAMEQQIAEAFRGIDPFIEGIVQYCMKFGGKRMRPALVFLTGKCFNRLSDKHIRIAAAIELIHTASLIHDDILDGAAIRRHFETVNVHWNSQIAVLAGDWILTRAMNLILENEDHHAFQKLIRAAGATCEGELRQIGTIGRFSMTEEEYFSVIAGKTAPLLACSTELGAWYAGADEDTVERLRLFGLNIGLAFQIVDDVLDMVGQTHQAGKTLRTDLLNRKPTLPLILYLENASPGDKETMLKMLEKQDLTHSDADRIIEKLMQTGCIEKTQQKAKTLIEQAIDLLTPIPGDKQALTALTHLARYVEKRQH